MENQDKKVTDETTLVCRWILDIISHSLEDPTDVSEIR